MSARRLKIGIACWPTYGGSGVLATELGHALAAKGHEIHFISYEYPIRLNEFRGNLFYHHVSVPDYPLFRYPPYALALATRMADVAETQGLDLIHAHYAIPHAISAHLAKEMCTRADLKVVATLHGTDVTIIGQDSSFTRITRFGIDRADGVTAVSRHLVDETRRTVGTTRAIEMIPNFVDLERFQAKPCNDALALRHEGEHVLIHVSNFRPVKRVGLIIEAVARIAKEVTLRLLMVGDGPDRARAETSSRELGIADRVHFLGSQEAVEKIIPCADLFLLPSNSESFGLAALEAMACGVPVLGSRSGGLPEVVEDGVTGRLFEVDDLDAMTAALRELLGDRERLRAMGVAARRSAGERFALERVLPMYEDFYERVLAGTAREGSAGAISS